jgi:uncharacterized RDD family membrane protein YckC
LRGFIFMQNLQTASLIRRLSACAYELLLLIAIWLVSAAIFIVLFGNAQAGWKRLGLQLILWLVAGTYFVWCWHKSGQTLAAQTWKIKLVNAQNETLNFKQALLRYVLASASLLALGLGFIWALVDKDQFFLHDRLLKTRLVQGS